MSAPPPKTIFYGPVINPESLSCFHCLPKCLLAVGASGDIVWFKKDVPESALIDVLAQHESGKITLHTLEHGEFLLPGFVDTHTVRTLPSHTMCGRGPAFSDDGCPSIARTPVPQSQVGMFCSVRYNVMLTRLLTTSGQQYELLDWLQKVTFPMETRFGKEEFARRAYEMIVKRTIDCGVYSSHFPGFKVLIGMS